MVNNTKDIQKQIEKLTTQNQQILEELQKLHVTFPQQAQELIAEQQKQIATFNEKLLEISNKQPIDFSKVFKLISDYQESQFKNYVENVNKTQQQFYDIFQKFNQQYFSFFNTNVGNIK